MRDDETLEISVSIFFGLWFVMPLWFLVCYAATQLATQLQQRCIQVVCSNK